MSRLIKILSNVKINVISKNMPIKISHIEITISGPNRAARIYL